MDKLLEIQAPRLKNGARNLQLIAVTTASVAKPVADAVRNRKVRIRAELATATDTVDLVFGPDNTITVNAALTGDQDGATAALGFRLAHGESVEFMLNGQDNFVAVMGTSVGQIRVLGRGRRISTGKADEGP